MSIDTNLCLYHAMRDNYLLDNMTPGEARQYYGAKVESFVKNAYGLRADQPLPPDEILTNTNSMGTIGILQAYLIEHPCLCFYILYENTKSFFLFGSEAPTQVFAFRHMGSLDGGHFIAERLTDETRHALLNKAKGAWNHFRP